MMRWPLPRWLDDSSVDATTRRVSQLGGRTADPDETDLGALRRFVASLERWPDAAKVTKINGAVLEVQFFEKADPLMGKPGDSGLSS